MDLQHEKVGLEYDHIGSPTTERSEGEVYHPDIKAHVCRVGDDSLRVEKIRFDPDAPFPSDIKNRPHVAFKVDNLQAAIEGKHIVVTPTEHKPGVRYAFVDVEGVLIELFEIG